jgi:hypothetical protein
MTHEELVEKTAEAMASHLFDGAPGLEMEREEIRIYAQAAIDVVLEEAAKCCRSLEDEAWTREADRTGELIESRIRALGNDEQ